MKSKLRGTVLKVLIGMNWAIVSVAVMHIPESIGKYQQILEDTRLIEEQQATVPVVSEAVRALLPTYPHALYGGQHLMGYLEPYQNNIKSLEEASWQPWQEGTVYGIGSVAYELVFEGEADTLDRCLRHLIANDTVSVVAMHLTKEAEGVHATLSLVSYMVLEEV